MPDPTIQITNHKPDPTIQIANRMPEPNFKKMRSLGMDHHINDYYCESSDETPRGNFHSVINLQEAADLTWENIHKKVPQLNKGWYELAHLDSKDRLEFTHSYWNTKLPYRQGLNELLDRFFNSLVDIAIYITQKKFDDPYEIEMVYVLKDSKGFYRGKEPISESNMNRLKKDFIGHILPSDYLAFLQIHDGFCKATDCTGLIKSVDMLDNNARLQELIKRHEQVLTTRGTRVNPKTLIPFYESFGMPFFQCFWTEWYPETEMGNVYYSGESNTISDIYSHKSNAETMAFTTFVDWLMFYLEQVE